jgi:hypothetical protein
MSRQEIEKKSPTCIRIGIASSSLALSSRLICVRVQDWQAYRGPSQSEFGHGGVRVHRRAQQNQEIWRETGAYPEMARALYSLRCCPCAASFAGARRQPKDEINIEMNGLEASSDFVYGFGKLDGAHARACVCAWRRHAPPCCVHGLADVPARPNLSCVTSQ